MIELKNIIKKYGDISAVDDLSFKINSGEIVGFLGPNGAGKSTTMKIIAGFLLPDKGEVLLDGKNIQEDPITAKTIIGYMPENNPLYKEMLVKEAIDYTMTLHNIAKDKRAEKIKYVVEATGLESVYYRPISELSKGYKQRVGLAQVLVNDPKVLILDEPTEGLDPNQRAEIRQLIKDLGKDRTVIISTHVMQEVEAMCSQIIIINKGKLVKEGTQEEIIRNEGLGNMIRVKLKTKSKKTIKDIIEKQKKDLTILKTKELKDEKDFLEMEYKVKDQDRFLEKFSGMIAENKWLVYELLTEKQNLEELFRELTK